MSNFEDMYVQAQDADDLALVAQKPGKFVRQFWNRFLMKKSKIVDCCEAEALAAFRNNINDEWLSRDFGH